MPGKARPKKLGRYEITDVLGKGAMGIVYKAIDPKINRTVAIKSLQVNSGMTEEDIVEFRDRFSREAQFAGKLSHTNIVTVYDVAEEGDTTYIAMEYIEGRTLEEIIEKRVPLKVKQIIDIMVQICEGLSFAHKNSVVHRDIKPANIIVTDDDTVKIMDFGVAKFSSSTATVAGTVMGTPSYMSPEQITGKAVDYRTDIFSLGAVFYELLTHEKAFPGNNITVTMYRVINEDPMPVNLINATVSTAFNSVIMRGLKKNPDERYQGADEMARDVRAAQDTMDVDMSSTQMIHADALQTMISQPAAGYKKEIDYRMLSLILGGWAGVSTLILLLMLIFGGSSSDSEIATALTAEKPASLFLNLNVPDATVTLNGQVIEAASAAVVFDSVGVGERKLVVARANYQTYETALVFGVGESKQVRIDLELAPVLFPEGADTSFLTVNSIPEMVKVEDTFGRFIGYTPFEQLAFPAGNYTFLFSRTDYVNRKLNASLPIKQVRTLFPKMVKQRGTVSLKEVWPESAYLVQNGTPVKSKSGSREYSLEVGEQLVLIRADGYYDQEKRLTVVNGETESLTDRLREAYGTVLFKSNPSGADIVLNDSKEPVGRTPFYLDSLMAFRHSIRGVFEKEEKKADFRVTKNDTTEVELVFSKPNGFLEVITVPPGAQIFISTSRQKDLKSPTIVELEPGSPRIRIRHPKFQEYYDATVEIVPLKTTQINYTFE